MGMKQKINGKTVTVLKTHGNLLLTNKEGKKITVKYTVELSHNNPLFLKHYMNLMGITLKEAVSKLEKCNALTLNEKFQIGFLSEKDVKDFFEISA